MATGSRDPSFAELTGGPATLLSAGSNLIECQLAQPKTLLPLGGLLRPQN